MVSGDICRVGDKRKERRKEKKREKREKRREEAQVARAQSTWRGEQPGRWFWHPGGALFRKRGKACGGGERKRERERGREEDEEYEKGGGRDGGIRMETQTRESKVKRLHVDTAGRARPVVHEVAIVV